MFNERDARYRESVEQLVAGLPGRSRDRVIRMIILKLHTRDILLDRVVENLKGNWRHVQLDRASTACQRRVA